MQLETLHQIAVHARDLDEAKAFYEDVLGARFIECYDPPGLLFFDFGGVRLMLEKGAKPATLYFRVDDMDRAHDELVAKGITIDNPPHMIFNDTEGTFGPPAEEWMAFFKDLDDNPIALMCEVREHDGT